MKILVADNDAAIAETVRQLVQSAGHSCKVVSNGLDAMHFCIDHPCDLLVLDRHLPGLDGLSLLKALRAANKDFMVLFLSPSQDVRERVEALNAGGDDYLTKPFDSAELSVRIQVLARRPKARLSARVLKTHDLELDLLSRNVCRAGTPIKLRAKEFALLECLMQDVGRVVTKTILLERVWSFNFDPRTSVVETHISRLRRKVDRPFPDALIRTVRNAGYSIHAPHKIAMPSEAMD